MESAHFLASLKRNDLSSFEQPPGFDYATEMEDVKSLRSSLEYHLGIRPMLDDQIQDSPHFAALGLRQEIDHEACAVIRFSKFGRLATIICEEKLGAESLELVLNQLQKHGYVYVPETIVESSYDGQIQGIETWMSRFFYYV